MACNGFHPHHQNQLGSDGGVHGGVNCTACAAGMVGEADSCGSLRFTGAQIRAASDEPNPDPKSPGLNLRQVEAALLKLSNGRIDLDTRKRYPFEKLRARISGGSVAILQVKRGVFIDAGEGHHNKFRGGHAITIGADNGNPWIDDPLTGRFPTTWETLRQAAGRLELNNHGSICGVGKAYVSFSRDITTDVAPSANGGSGHQAGGRVSIGPGAGEEKRRFGLYTVVGRTVVGVQVRRTGGFSATCSAPRLYTWPGHSSQSLVVVLDRFLADQAHAQGVTFAIRSSHMTEN